MGNNYDPTGMIAPSRSQGNPGRDEPPTYSPAQLPATGDLAIPPPPPPPSIFPEPYYPPPPPPLDHVPTLKHNNNSYVAPVK